MQDAARRRHQRAGQGGADAQRAQGTTWRPCWRVLPALKRPTISHLSDEEWLAVNTILDESTVRDIIPRLKQAGGAGNRRIPAEQDRAVIRILESKEVGRLLARKAARLGEAEAVVRPILEAVRTRGDRALMEYARQFDGFARASVRVPERELAERRAASWRRRFAAPSRPRPRNIRAFAAAPDAAPRGCAARARACGWARSCGRSIPWRPTFRPAAIRCLPRC